MPHRGGFHICPRLLPQAAQAHIECAPAEANKKPQLANKLGQLSVLFCKAGVFRLGDQLHKAVGVAGCAQAFHKVAAAHKVYEPRQDLQMQALTARRNSDHEHKVHRFPVRCAPVNTAAQQQRRDARCGHARVAGVGQRNAAPDGRCAAERFPVADRIVVGIAVVLCLNDEFCNIHTFYHIHHLY